MEIKGNSKEEARVILKEKLRVYDDKTEKWTSGTLWAKSDGTVKCEGKEIGVGPFVTTTRPKFGNFDFVFVINTEIETKTKTGPRFACQTLASCERWISLLNLLALQKKMKLKHLHPLTEMDAKKGLKVNCNICKGLATQHFACEFCNYYECRECNKQLKEKLEEFVTSIHHPHPLMRLNSARGMWISSEYKGTYQCDRCDAVSNTTVYHCVECGDYDLCPKCTYELPQGQMSGRMETIEARTPAELRLNEQFLAPVLKTEGNKYSLVNAHDHKCPEKMSMITTKCFNLNEIDSEVHPSAYMEVTFTEIDKKGIVGVGIGNQIFGQNNFLGHQQNSFGVFNNGTICMNNTSNQQSFPSIAFVAGDTIGIGVMKDSFNQRTVFFTKNGNKIGIFEWRVHTGMDCFPGVSFSKSSGVVFSVNMSGPFKCDLKQVAEPRTDKDMLSTMPVEIIEMIGAMAVTSDRRALQLREINKVFAAVMQGNAVWRSLFLQKWTNQNKNLKVKSWQQLYRKRNTAMKTAIDAHPIENCDMEFECPILWERLEGKGVQKKGERYCDKCKKTVYEVQDEATMNVYTEMGRCVSLLEPRGIDINDERDDYRFEKRGKRAPPKRSGFVDNNPFK